MCQSAGPRATACGLKLRQSTKPQAPRATPESLPAAPHCAPQPQESALVGEPPTNIIRIMRLAAIRLRAARLSHRGRCASPSVGFAQQRIMCIMFRWWSTSSRALLSRLGALTRPRRIRHALRSLGLRPASATCAAVAALSGQRWARPALPWPAACVRYVRAHRWPPPSCGCGAQCGAAGRPCKGKGRGAGSRPRGKPPHFPRGKPLLKEYSARMVSHEVVPVSACLARENSCCSSGDCARACLPRQARAGRWAKSGEPAPARPLDRAAHLQLNQCVRPIFRSLRVDQVSA